MDRKYSNLGKPPPKLRYFKTTDRSDTNKIRTVVRNIQDSFDELDSSPNTGGELSVLSPLAKTWTLSEDVEVQSIILLPVMGSSEKLACNEGTPSKNCVPKRISSQAGLVADDDDGDGDEGHHRASPLLFFNEDEVPESDAIKTVQLNKKSQMTRKDFEESSEDELESPPKKFVLGKSLKASTGSKGLKQREASCSFSSDEEFLSLQSKNVDVVPGVPSQKSRAFVEMTGTAPKVYKGKPSKPPEKLDDHPHPLEKNHKNTLVSGVKSLKEGRKSSAFLLKLKDTGRSETMRFRKETSPIQVSQHLEADEDFMILEDENLRNSFRFSIPRRTEEKTNNLPLPHHKEVVMHNKERGTSEAAANANHNLAQKKQNRSKGAKCKKINELDTVDLKTKGTRGKGVDKMPLDIPATVQSKAMQNSLQEQEKVGRCTETQTAHIVDEDGDVLLLRSPEVEKPANSEEEVAQGNNRIQPRMTSSQSAGKNTQISKKKSASNKRIQTLKKIVSEVSRLPEESEERRVDEGGEDHACSYPSPDPGQHVPTPNETQKRSKAKQLRRCPKEIWRKPVNLKNGGVGTPLNISENEAQLECHEMGKRKRLNPGSWWLLGREKRTDECSNKAIHSSVVNRRSKQNKTRPELILSPGAEEDVAQENDRIQPRLASSQSAGKTTQISKKKSASNKRIQTLKKIVSEVSRLPEESEEGRVDEGGEDHACSYPSPDPGQHVPTPNETQKRSKAKQLRRLPKEIWEKPVNPKNGGVRTPLNISENEAQLERHEMGKRKRLNPGSWWLLGQEERTDECSNKAIHGSVANRRRKQNKTRPELILSPDAEEDVAQENDRIQPRLTSSQSAGKTTQISKKKSASNKRIQTLKKIVSEVSRLPEESEEGRVDEGGEDHACSYPSPDPGQHVPTPNETQKRSKAKQLRRLPKEIWEKPVNPKNGGVRTPLNISENEAQLERHEMGKRKRLNPGSWWLLGREKRTDECSNKAIHGSVANRRRKQNKTRPELILSPDAEEDVAQENDRIQPRLTSSQSAGKTTQISKKKSASNKRIQTLKKIVSEVSRLPEESEEGRVDEGGEDHACSYPSPDPGQHVPTPNETQKRSKAKQLRGCPKEILENPENLKNGWVGTPLNICENEAQLERHEMGKRKRLNPGSWWVLGQEERTDECRNNEIHSSVVNRRRKQNKTRPEVILSPDAEEDVAQENDRIQPRLTSSQSAGKNTQISKKKSASNKRIQTLKKIVSEVSGLPEESEEGRVDEGGEDHACSYPSPDPGQHVPTPRSQRGFEEVYTQPKQDRRPNKLPPSSHRSYAQSPLTEKGQMKVPYNWLEYEESEALVVCSPQLHHHPETQVLPKPRKGSKSFESAFKKSANILSSAKPRDKFRQTFSKRNHLHAPMNIRASLASSGDIFTPVGAKTTQTARDSASRQTAGLTKTIFPSQGDQCVSSKYSSDVYEYRQNGSDYPANCPTAKTHSRAMHGKGHSGTTLAMDSSRLHQFVELQSEVDACNGFKSGQSSMLDVQEKSLPSWQNFPSESKMCGPPLEPVTLQMEDREMLVIWLKNIWTSPAGTPIISPEHFHWYGYRGRAMGYKTDLQYETFSNGKILLGSYMKKPMQVDTSATSVYNILTSSVCVTINGVEADLSSGETFVVPCGHAHGMRNLTAEPAVLLYHRMVAESSDIWE